MNQKIMPIDKQGFSQIILLGIVAVFILAGAGGFLVLREKRMPPSLEKPSSPKTSETAKLEPQEVFTLIAPYRSETDITSNGTFSDTNNSPWGFKHLGIDFMASNDLQEFVAATDGIISNLNLTQNEKTGNWQAGLCIERDPFMVCYAFEPFSKSDVIGKKQLSEISVSNGQKIKQGEVIGRLVYGGDGAHVDFGILSAEGNRVCPEPYFSEDAKDSIIRIVKKSHPTWKMCYTGNDLIDQPLENKSAVESPQSAVELKPQKDASETLPVSAKNAPRITSVFPSLGKTNTLIKITGSSFTETGNDIHFSANSINGGLKNVNSSDNGTLLTFIIPESIGGCYYPSPSAWLGTKCVEPITSVIAGEYELQVSNINGVSNKISFAVSSSSVNGEQPADQAINQDQPQKASSVSASASKIPPCIPGKKDYFSVLPVALENVEGIDPMGHLRPPGRIFPNDHIAFMMKAGGGTVPILSPGDIWVTTIREQVNVAENLTSNALFFSSCLDIIHALGYVETFSQKLSDAFIEPFESLSENNYRYRYKNVEIHFSPGEILGTIKMAEKKFGKPSPIDFTTVDRTAPELVFANPARWRNDLKHTACPLDYFSSDLKGILKNFMSSSQSIYGTRTEEPVCGEVAQDVPGTVQGAWVTKGTPDVFPNPEDKHLALVHDKFNPKLGVISMGNSLSSAGVDTGLYYFTPAHTGEYNREFKEIFPDSKVYCYDYDGSYTPLSPPSFYSVPAPKHSFIIQLTSPTALRVGKLETICGSGPWTFGPNYVDFER